MLQPTLSLTTKFKDKMKKEKSPPSLSTQQVLEKLVEERCAAAKTKEAGVINTEPLVKRARVGTIDIESQEQKKDKESV